MKRPSLPKISKPQIRHRKEMHAAQLAEREKARQTMLAYLSDTLAKAQVETDPAAKIKLLEEIDDMVDISIKGKNSEAYKKRKSPEKKGLIVHTACIAVTVAALVASSPITGLISVGAGIWLGGMYIGNKNSKNFMKENEAYLNKVKAIRSEAAELLTQTVEEGDMEAFKVSPDFTGVLKTYSRLQERFVEAVRNDAKPRTISKSRANKPVDPKI